MMVGIKGFKGHIKYHCAPCINEWLGSLKHDMPKSQLFDTVAAYIDQQIHSNYRLFANNYVAHDLLQGNKDYSSMYTPQQRSSFEQYIMAQIDKIDMENKDTDFLRERMLTMYAYPVRNHKAATEGTGSRFKALKSHFGFGKS